MMRPGDPPPPANTYAPIFDLGGLTLIPGVYNDPTSFEITGVLTLDGQGSPDSVWIFQTGSTLLTASNSSISLINGADACNIFWQVGSSATLGTGTDFAGTIMALTSHLRMGRRRWSTVICWFSSVEMFACTQTSFSSQIASTMDVKPMFSCW